MAAFSDQELRDICGLNLDGIAGFRAQIVTPRRRVIWPEHFRGRRITDFERGANIAARYAAYRRGMGLSRRSSRAKDFQTMGATTNLVPRGGERKREQLEVLREIMRFEQAAG